MPVVRVSSQEDLDAALAEHGTDEHAEIVIDSPSGVWLNISASGSATVRASGYATVRAWDSSMVLAWDYATVLALGSATVHASGYATVLASGSATVHASGYATVRAGKYVAVHLHSKRVQVSGGVVIDVTDLDHSDPRTWLDLNGIEVDRDGQCVLYKAVDSDLNAGFGYRITEYPIGGKVTAEDWRADRNRGHGLHLSPDPLMALTYYTGKSPARLLACRVSADSLIPLDDQCKVERLLVLHEVDARGRKVTA